MVCLCNNFIQPFKKVLLIVSVTIPQSTQQPRTEYAPPPQVSGFTVVPKKEPDQQPKVPETSLSPTAFLTTDASLYEQQLHQQHQERSFTLIVQSVAA